MIKKNQIHQPAPKRVRVDKNGNDTRKLWLKDHDTTMLICRGLTENGCKLLVNSINSTLEKLGHEKLPHNRFLITK